jgi:WD40 repeat protein
MLWDAFTGQVRCSYVLESHTGQICGPYSVAFNSNGSKIYCGQKDCIYVFDVAVPGNTGSQYPTTPSKRSKDRHKGIVSCMDFAPDGSGLFAVGAFSSYVGIYDERSMELAWLMTTQGTGVTQVKFTADSLHLLTASRHDDAIRMWDIRNTGDMVCAWPCVKRDTNQRVYFDLKDGMLATGDAACIPCKV